MKNIYKAVVLLCVLSAFTVNVAGVAPAAPEAEYRKLSKEYTLNPDGSQEYRCNMELTLFTHTAMNKTYGESFIFYDPSYQELKIHSSYTKQKDGNIVTTPDNAFVEVLPRYAADAPAYNRLTEMVIVHTGLELGATIYLDYSIITKPGRLPELDIYDEILRTSPVKEYDIVINVPEGKQVNYTLNGAGTKPETSAVGGTTRIAWKLRNLPASSMAPGVSAAGGDVPFLAATTYSSEAASLNALCGRFDRTASPEVAALAASLTGNKATQTEKLQAILGYVNDRVGNCPLSLAHTGYAVRPAAEVVRTAYGTPAEKANLLAALLSASGMKAEPAAIYKTEADERSCGLSAIDELAVVSEADGKTYLLDPLSRNMSRVGSVSDIVPVRNLANAGKKMTFNTPPQVVNYKTVIKLTPEKAVMQTTAAVSSSFLPYDGEYITVYAGRDKDATAVENDGITAITFKGEQRLTNNGGLVTVGLPDAPVSLSRSPYVRSNSSRSENLVLPYAANESYTYTVEIPDNMELRTPVGDKIIDNKAGRMAVSMKNDGNRVEVVRTLEIKKKVITPQDYADFRSLMTAWGDANDRLLLFKVR